MKTRILMLAAVAAMMTPMAVMAEDAKPAAGKMDCPFIDTSLVSYEDCIGSGYEAVAKLKKVSQTEDVMLAKAEWWRVQGKLKLLTDALAKADASADPLRAAGKDLQDVVDSAGAVIQLREKDPAALAQPAPAVAATPVPATDMVPNAAQGEVMSNPSGKTMTRPELKPPMPTYY